MELKEDGVITQGHNKHDVDVDDNTRVKLEQLGITRDQSSNYQAMAAIPETTHHKVCIWGVSSSLCLMR
ncbi:hypothetical protein [Chroococcidiopsis thermalis]|uniref:hypothetical protein n=1 Tax=Chroococcidiopsis thermalis TaxID=54299 RepID=UPI0015EFE55A|nr:hypothetical protein [Chroococcidiopsis thermalis]